MAMSYSQNLKELKQLANIFGMQILKLMVKLLQCWTLQVQSPHIFTMNTVFNVSPGSMRPATKLYT